MQIPLALHSAECFTKASGLQLNTAQCKLMTIHELYLISLYNTPVRKEVKYLRITNLKEDIRKT